MTFTQILADLYRRLGYGSTPASEVSTRLTAFVSQTQRQILTSPGLQKLRDGMITFDSVANQALYGLPPIVAKVEHLRDEVNRRPLVERPLTWLRSTDPGLVNIGSPASVYVPLGPQPVIKQPSGPTEIFVVSTDAGDTQMAYLEAVRTGGYPISLSVGLTGITPVSFGVDYVDIIEITKFYLASLAVGTVTLSEGLP